MEVNFVSIYIIQSNYKMHFLYFSLFGVFLNFPIQLYALSGCGFSSYFGLFLHLWQCCNHPYVNDLTLQTSLTKGLEQVEYLDIGIKASGKLYVLDSMLTELKKEGLRGLVLFQVYSWLTIFPDKSSKCFASLSFSHSFEFHLCYRAWLLLK